MSSLFKIWRNGKSRLEDNTNKKRKNTVLTVASPEILGIEINTPVIFKMVMLESNINSAV